MRARPRGAVAAVLALTLTVLPAGAATTASAAASTDPFYAYSGSVPLASLAPGTVLKTRTIPYHVVGIPVPLQAVQLLYRSTGLLGQPTANVTSVIKPPVRSGAPKAVTYQSAYDSLNPEHGPSRAIAGDVNIPGLINNAEGALLIPWLSRGYTVLFPDTEGQAADFAAGPEYGMNTLDSIRAAENSAATGLGKDTKVGAFGYSGGAIGTGWAAQLAPTYAPEVDRNLVGAAEGGVLVDPRRNLDYVNGSLIWAGAILMAVTGAARAADIDVTPYLNDNGLKLYEKFKNSSIIEVLPQTIGLTWQSLVKPEYASSPDTIPAFVDVIKKLNMLNAGSPTTPMLIGQGANGVLEGTPGNKPGIGPGDGVMVAGDVRALAEKFCADGTTVQYNQYDALAHGSAGVAWFPLALLWLDDRMSGKAAPDNCAQLH